LTRSARGAYGISIAGMAAARPMLVDARPGWPRLRLVTELDDPPAGSETVTDDRAQLMLKTGGRLTLDRTRGLAHYTVPRPLSADELVHPYLAPAAAVVAHWTHRLSFHAGAFVGAGGTWGLVGDRAAGKSSTLAWLALNGHEVVADDVLVLQDGIAYAGPRSIDLREDAAERFGVGTALGVVGTRPRWRVVLPPIDPELPFRGWIFLAWGQRLESRRVGGSECLRRLVAQLALRLPVADPAYLLELASLPAWELRRPRDWRLLCQSGESLLRGPVAA
jgi:hypothetical protein